MRTTWADRLKAFFAKDGCSYWFEHFTDEEKELRRMNSWQLARVIHEETVRSQNPEKRIVAEHMLQVRVAKIQNRATYVSVVVGFIGILVGAALSAMLQ
ncbi:hypothetical protein [Marinobacter xestospongiae]|uniref:Uncharacterized protein n=1 Tax=Marinobacter xestospongiae TaxID=994319 RepID=A0ABU3W3D8_9GAMM|nr:hypothetical protein [Marinobacter xestospongiae]MDV2081064.1 hypothetical protein [Marinobacter xestospongiae]